MAQLLQKEDQAESAAQLQGACRQLLGEMDAPLEPYEQKCYDASRESLKQRLGESAYQQTFEAGKRLSLEQARALALAPSKL